MPIHPALQAMLDKAVNLPPMHTVPLAAIRATDLKRYDIGVPKDEVASAEDRTIPGPRGEIRIRIYRPDLQDEYLMEMRAQAVRAIVMLGAVESQQLSAALAGEAPVLFVNRRCPGGLSAPFVGIDNSAAGAAVADFLKSHRPKGRVAVIHGPLTSSATADRISAFCRSFKDSRGRLAARDVVTAPGLDHLEIGHSAMTSLLSRGPAPTSIFCSSDLIAFGAYRSLRAAGLAVPRDVLLVGFDDSPLNDWVAPWLSSVRVPYRDFGTTIVSALERIWLRETPEIALLGFELIERR
jgi:LacI family transcriptional regulator